MTIDGAFQASMMFFPDATVALGHAPDSFCLVPLWLLALHEFVSGRQLWRLSPPEPGLSNASSGPSGVFLRHTGSKTPRIETHASSTVHRNVTP